MSAPENRTMLIWLGVFTIATLATISYMALKVGAIKIGNDQAFRLQFASAIGIPENADVRVSGIKVGRVTGLELADTGGAWVWIAIRPDFAVYSDARAVIKSKSLLGERFIEIQPGHREPRLESGASITDTVTPLRIEDLGEILGPIVNSVDSESLSAAMKGIVNVVLENREAIQQGAQALAQALSQMSKMVDDPQEVAKVRQFLDALADVTIRIDRLLRENDAEIKSAMADLAAMAKELRKLSTELPETGKDAAQILARVNRVLAKMEDIDTYKVGLILKTVLQQEGLTFSVRGYTQNEIRAQMDSYEKLFANRPTQPSETP